MSKEKSEWRSFWIDVNSFWRRINSREVWERSVKIFREDYGFGVDLLLNARQSSSGMFVFGYAPYHRGLTLKEWAEKNGMDLRIEENENSSEGGNVVNLSDRRR